MEKSNKKCALWFCDGWHYAHDLCLRHRVAERRYGSPFGIDGRDEIAILQRVDDLRTMLVMMVDRSQDENGRCRYCGSGPDDSEHQSGCIVKYAASLVIATPPIQRRWMTLPVVGEMRKLRERSRRDEEMDDPVA